MSILLWEGKILVETAAGKGFRQIRARAIRLGEDLMVSVVGGDTPHLGSVAVAIPRPSLRDASRISATVSVFNLVGHKDDEIARPMAIELSRQLNRVVAVAAGVHLSKAKEDDIDKLLENAKLVSANLVKLLRKVCK